MNGRLCMLCCRTQCKGRIVNGQQALTFPFFSSNDRLKCITVRRDRFATSFDFAHQVEHDRPSYDRINNHLSPPFMYRLKWPDNVVSCLVQHISVIVFLDYTLLFHVCLEKEVFTIELVNLLNEFRETAFGFKVTL